MFSKKSYQDELNSIIASINALRPIENTIPARWRNIFSNLTDFLNRYPNEHSNNDLICAIINFISNYDTSVTKRFFSDCNQINIGYSHSLWYTSYAIEFEREKNYIKALDIYMTSISRNVSPIEFLIECFDSFKERMLKRLYGNYKLDLGFIDNDKYAFERGEFNCRDVRTNLPSNPKYDFLSLIDFDHSKAKEYSSPQSVSKSFTKSKFSNYQPDFSFNNFSPPQCEQVEYPANDYQNHHSSFLSPTSQPQKQSSFSLQNQIYEQQENNLFQPSSHSILQPSSYQYGRDNSQNHSGHLIFNNNDQSQTELSFPFNQAEPKPILKKNKSPSPSRSNTSGVRFNNKAQPTNDKKRASTPVGKINKLEVGGKIIADIYEFQIIQQIGSGAFLGIYQDIKYVIKRFPPSYVNFTPRYPFLFCLPIENIDTFYVTKFSIYGTFDKVMSIIHNKNVDESIAMFFLLQLLLIVNDLESNSMSYGNICPEKLINKLSESDAPRTFDLNDQYWQESGIQLCACDEIKNNNDEGIEDRKAVARLFYQLATKKEIDDDFEKPPARWNKEIWTKIFQILQTKDSLDPLIESIYAFIQKNVMKLRSSLSRTYIEVQKQLFGSQE